MTRSQKPRWPLILSMKSASERRCRKRKGGGQTGRDKQDGANAACFKYPGVSDSSTYAFKFCIYHFTRLFSTNCMPDIMLGQWKGRAWPRGSHPSVCVRVCVRVCVCVCVCVRACLCAHREYLQGPISGLLHGILDLMDARSLLRGFVYSWVVSLSSTGLSHSVFLSLPNLFNI